MESSKQIKKYEAEIASMYKTRNLLLILALVSLGVAANSLAILWALNISYLGEQLLRYLAITNIISAIVLFIVRSAAFNGRISNRRKAIEKLKNASPVEEEPTDN